jgi:hypothetical protein
MTVVGPRHTVADREHTMVAALRGRLSRGPSRGATAEVQAEAPRPTSWPARTAAAVAPASTGPERAEGDQQAKIGLTEVSAVLRVARSGSGCH